MKNLGFYLAFFLFNVPSAYADVSVVFAGPNSAILNLVEEQKIPLHVQAAAATEVDLALVTTDLTEDVKAGALELETIPAHISLKAGEASDFILRIKTTSAASSFDGKHFAINAVSLGKTLGQADVELSVKAIYKVKVIDGDPFNFDSQVEEISFPSHDEGLQLVFENYSSRACVLHGDGDIEHQDTANPMLPAHLAKDGTLQLDPKGTYSPTLILPRDGKDLKSSYTIHNVYHPTRQVILNATK